MKSKVIQTSCDLQFAQIAWVVQDIQATLEFFRDNMGIQNFSPIATTRLKEYKATYYGEPCEAENLVSMAYNGGTFIELIQPLSGKSIFKDYLDQNPAGGVHHVAFRVPISELEKLTSELMGKGYPVIASFDTPIAYIVFFDTFKETGVLTEIMGITKEGELAVENMKVSEVYK